MRGAVGDWGEVLGGDGGRRSKAAVGRSRSQRDRAGPQGAL